MQTVSWLNDFVISYSNEITVRTSNTERAADYKEASQVNHTADRLCIRGPELQNRNMQEVIFQDSRIEIFVLELHSTTEETSGVLFLLYDGLRR